MHSVSHPELIRLLDVVLPVSSVLEQAAAFLRSCDWALEIEGEQINIPAGVELLVRSRAFIKAELDDVFLADHFEAVILLGSVRVGGNVRARYGVLRMYFNPEGQFVSEDRYNAHA